MDVNEAIQLARKYHLAGNLEKAEHIYREVLRIQPTNVGAYYELGNVFQAQGRLDEAVDCYRKATGLDPNFAGSFNNLGNVFQKKGQIDEAIVYYQRAIELDPEFAGTYINLGLLFFHRGRLDEATSYFEKAIQLEPDSVDAYFNLGNIFKSQGKTDKAVQHYLKAIELNPQCPEFYFNTGVALQAENKLDQAMTYYKKTVELDPDFARAYLNISLILLLSGDFQRGWKEYEWRWKLKEFYQLLPNTSKPIWNGSDIKRLTVFLYAEQGLGDTIQFLRYIPLVAERGAKVVVECQKELMTLAQNVRGVSRVMAQGEKLPEFDIHCSLLSLPLIFDTTLENIPASVPYITADSLLLKKWKDKLQSDGSKLKIGLVWAGSAANITGLYRSCSLDAFSPLALPDITFYSLQKGDASIQAKTPPEGMKLIDYTADISDFSDTAALIENLDLVISVDTAVAHLAGAMGKPVWTLIPFVPDWRWMLDREDSPWYPTMRLFRQPARGDWESVIKKLSEELKTFRSEKKR